MTDEEAYDVIVMGTGLKECILSGLLAVAKKKVLHIDRNDFYGGESASLNLKSLKQNLDGMTDEEARKWCTENEKEGLKLGRFRDYNIDLCPKLVMANGNLVKMLIHSKVTRYLDFNVVDGSFIYQKKQEELHEVPTNPKAVWASSLVGMMQKYRFKEFLQWVIAVDPNDDKTWKGKDLKAQPMSEIYAYWKCGEAIEEVCGHAVGLYPNDNYKSDPKQTLTFIQRLQLYYTSLLAYDGNSPYIYPLYGLGGLPEGFSRLAAVYGGTYMLRTPVQEIMYNEGKVQGIKYISPDTKEVCTAYCKQLIGDPSYFQGTDKVKFTGYIARRICILNGMPEFKGKEAGSVNSCQVILPTTQTGHSSNIYICILGNPLQCAPKGMYVCVMQTRVGGNLPEDAQHEDVMAHAEKVLDVAFRKVKGVCVQEWISYRKTYTPTDPKKRFGEQVFIPSSMDATTHFANATKQVMNIYHSMTGTPVDLSAKPEDLNEEA